MTTFPPVEIAAGHYGVILMSIIVALFASVYLLFTSGLDDDE